MARFSDVSDSDWFAPAVYRLADLGIIQGYPDGTFRPHTPVSLAEMLKLLLNAMGIWESTDTVPWYANYARRAREESMLEDGPDPDFTAPVTRAALARLLCRGARLPLVQWDAFVYADVEAADKPWADTVFDEYLMRGYWDGNDRSFGPARQVIRAEAAVVTERFLDHRQDRTAYLRRVAHSIVAGDRLLQQGFVVLASLGGAIWAAGQDDRVLSRSTDRGESFTRVHQFERGIRAIHVTPRGIMLVSTGYRGWESVTDCEIYRSGDGGFTFERVLQLGAGYARFWSFASDANGYIYIAEYGYKDLPNNARRVYRSADDGRTWRVIYQPPEATGYHNHRLLVDKDDARVVYLSVGDGPNSRILKSTDRGDTWRAIHQVGEVNPTSAWQFDNYIVWGLDNTPYAGWIRLGRNGEWRGEFRPPQPYHGPAYDLIEVNGVLYCGLLSYEWASHWWDGSLWVSLDQGRTFQLWGTWPKVPGQGIGLYTFTRHGDDLYLHVTLPLQEGGAVIPFEGTFRLPLYRS